MPEHVITLTDAELEDIRCSVRARRQRVVNLASEVDLAGNSAMRDLLFALVDRLDALDRKLATREVDHG